MTRLLALIISTSLVITLGCGGGGSTGPTQTAATTPGTAHASEKPPALVVSGSAGTMEAALGSYCWDTTDRTTCADSVSVVTPQTPLVTSVDQSISGVLSGLKISNVHVQASPLSGTSGAVVGDNLIEWAYSEATYELAAPIRDGELAIDISTLDPGQYVIAVSLEVAGHGDATYGFLLSKGDAG